MPDTTLLLFRNDLRLQDNAALSAALTSGQRVLPLYIFDETAARQAPASASRWWLHHSLDSLSQTIKEHGGRLYLARGNTLSQLKDIIPAVNVSKIYFNRGYEPYQREVEEAIYDRWHGDIEVKRFGGHLLFEPEQVLNGQGEPYKVFTPFWKACLKQPEPRVAMTSPIPESVFYQPRIACDNLHDWQLLPTRPDWAEGFRQTWQPGETGASKVLRHFLEGGLSHYDSDRDRPDIYGTSMLSPHLHFGEIAPARIWQEVKAYSDQHSELHKQAMCYLRELGWRDFSNHLLFHWPGLPDKPFRPEFAEFPWHKDQKGLELWQSGQTGFPVVDAGMRQLWYTGWMHNRVRMIVASFLVKHQLVHWQEGERWFWDTLVDADLANNVASWQWVAGCGADAAPYFRVFNPILQGKKFDPNGDYVRQWVPELTGLPNDVIHEPWTADSKTLSAAGICLGTDYPTPVIKHEDGRKQALDAFHRFRNQD